jgi:hypothetical protein
MIVFDLHCRDGGETFEAWFRSNADYDEQRDAGLVQCPFCQSENVAKAPMAPSVPRKATDTVFAGWPRCRRMLGIALGRGCFPTRPARYRRIEPAQVHGSATLAQAKALDDDGVPVAPLPLLVIPPTQVN